MSLDQKTPAQPLADRVFEEFEPPSDWDHDEGSHTLILMLPGFKKEQMRVQVTSTRILKLSGERQISENKWRRFHKEFTIPTDSDTSGISAKFEAGMLYVRLPKMIKKLQIPNNNVPKPQQPTTTDQKPTQQEAPKPQQPITTVHKPTQQETPKPQKPTIEKPNAQVVDDQKRPKVEDKVVESKVEAQKPLLQEHKSDEDSQKKPYKEKGRVETDQYANNKADKEREEGAILASKVQEMHGSSSDGLGKRGGKMDKRSLTMEMLSQQSQEYMKALSSLMEEVKKQKKLANMLVVVFFVLLLGLYVKNAIKS
ncbi:HSP20-like chaperone [Sesbania bispinosa]|nr:HSP20-like chaperone [Sesbania bispinosa]